MKTIGERLRDARGTKTQTEVCAIVGISRSALGMYEKNMRIPRDQVKKKLAKLYEKSIEELFF